MAATMAEQLEQLTKAPLKHKVLGLALVTVLFGAVFYFVFYSDLADKLKSIENKAALLEQEVASYEQKKQNYMRFRAEVNKLLEQQKELLKVLPSHAEIPSFLQALHAQGELAGLNILTFQPGAEVPQNFYAKIPVRMSISGSYHQITKFFYSVGRLKRIVNIENVQLVKPQVTDEGVVLQADFVASTFRFIEPKANPAAQQQQRGG